jgi:hypothetical protein
MIFQQNKTTKVMDVKEEYLGGDREGKWEGTW